MSTGHAKLAPSSAGRWAHCPGSVVMEGHFPDEGEDGLEGEASHWVASSCLAHGEVHNAGERAPNGVVLDTTMVGGAFEYTKAVAQDSAGVTLHVEQTVSCATIHPECWGTPDCRYYLVDRNKLHVWDYKYGWGLVDVVGNKQLICYATGVLPLLPPGNPTIVFHIVQPRPYHRLGSIREWRTTAAALQPEIEKLRLAAQEALSPEPRCITGSHCRYCRARHACPPFRSAAYAALEYVERAQPHELTPDALGVELEILERAGQMIKHLKTGVDAQAMGLIQQGVHVPGWTIEREKGRSTWTVPDAVLFAMGDLHKVDLRNTKPLTPYQARNAGFPSDAVRTFSTSPLGDPKLVKMSRSLTAQIFGPAAASREKGE